MANWESLFSFHNRDTIFTCSSCKKENPVQDKDNIVIIACPNCHKIHSKYHLEQYLRLHNSFTQGTYSLKLNQAGWYKDEKYRIAGIANKQEQQNAYSRWTEHILLNEKNQVSFLNECYGHYTWMTEKKDIPTNNINDYIKNGITYDGRKYRFLSRYKYKTNSCLGTFYYDPVDVKHINCYDFVSPPYAISIEVHDKGHREAFHGFHIPSSKVSSVFEGSNITLQHKEGVGMAQPFYFGINIDIFKKGMIIFIAFMILLSIGMAILKDSNQTFLISTFEGSSANSGKEFVTKSFTLQPSAVPYYLNFEGYAVVNNEWVDMALTLVNETTGEEREFGLTIEAYSGIDNGYSWSEGSYNTKVNLSGVEPGRYHVKCKLFNSCVENTAVDFYCRTASPLAWNSLFIIITLAIITVLFTRMSVQFERMRRGEIDNLLGT